MTTNLERELKLDAPEGFSLARLPRELKSFIATPAEFQRLHTVYFDSEDLRLMRWGCSLRYRRGEGWTLKIPVLDENKTLNREEHEFEGDEQKPPQAALELATAYLRGAPVKRVAELRTLRVKREFRNGDGEDVAEVVEDDVRVLDGTHVAKRFLQVEIELEDGADVNAVDAIANLLRSEGAGKPDPTPKNVIALTEGDFQPEITIPKISPMSPAGDVARAAIGKSAMQLIESDAKLRTSDDAEAVHQARVAVRRLRSDLQTFAPLFETEWVCGLRERLRWLQDRFSPVRDIDILVDHLEELSEQLSPTDVARAEELIEVWRKERAQAHEALRNEIREPRYAELLDEIVEAATHPKEVEMAKQPACDVAPKLLLSAFKKVRKSVRRAGLPPSDRELHQIRIKAKHLRYGSEAFVAVLGRRAERLASEAEALQTILGDEHDGVVMMKRLRECAGPQERVFVAGELAMLAMERACEARDRWRGQWKKIKTNQLVDFIRRAG